MPTIREACRVCGQSLVIHIAQPFVQAAAVAPVCPACTDLQFLDQGGALVALRRDLPGARFPLGKSTITGGAVEALGEASQHAVEFLARHARGDWGAFGQCDQIEKRSPNLRALTGPRAGPMIWVRVAPEKPVPPSAGSR